MLSANHVLSSYKCGQKGKTKKSFRFGVPMVWREQKNHFDDCYFCMVDLKGFNRHKKISWIYSDLEYARRTVPH